MALAFPSPSPAEWPFPRLLTLHCTTWTSLPDLDHNEQSSKALVSSPLLVLKNYCGCPRALFMWVLPVIHPVHRISSYLAWILTILKIKTEKNLKRCL